MSNPELPREPKAKSQRGPSKSKAQTSKPAASKAKSPALIISTPKPAASPGGDLHAIIAKRAYELYAERGYQHGHATEDWLEAEREILSQVPPA